MSKWWKDMPISKTNNNHNNNDININNNNYKNDFIISRDIPIKYNDNKNIKIKIGLNPDEYSEVCDFIKENNKMSSGNTTLLNPDELENLMTLDNIIITIRSQGKNKLIGTIISINLPITNKEDNNNEIVIHGCTTYLNVHKMLQGHGLCMSLIRSLTQEGYKNGIYCSYHTVPFKLGDNSIPIKSWYRPINLKRSIELGFLFPGYNTDRNIRRNRLKYRTDLPKGCKYIKIDNTNASDINISYNLYYDLVKDKRFYFSPDKALWEKWVSIYPTYMIYHNNDMVGIVTIYTIHCIIEKTKEEDKIAIPIICLGNMDIVLPTLIHIVKTLEYPVLYFYQTGDVKQNNMNDINGIKSDGITWFSLYNNRIQLKPDEISVPFL
jgi:hypothetical protein